MNKDWKPKIQTYKAKDTKGKKVNKVKEIEKIDSDIEDTYIYTTFNDQYLNTPDVIHNHYKYCMYYNSLFLKLFYFNFYIITIPLIVI